MTPHTHNAGDFKVFCPRYQGTNRDFMLPTSQEGTQELGLSTSPGRKRISALPPSHSTNSLSALVEYMSPKSNQKYEELEVKRYQIKETSISQFIQRILSNPQNTNPILNPQYREITQNPVFTSKSQLTSPKTMQELQDNLEAVKMEQPQGHDEL
uniref:Uncharacterized protein n=1 Tax=Lactuca sativa TaxID=4236 RepID=A0A9R1X935_LACSA|nr:hypothetical protein LSAT_V11C500253860 [Lactuca sativa]